MHPIPNVVFNTMNTTCTPRLLTVTPRARVRPIAEGYLLEVDLPGVPREGLDLELAERRLTVAGRRSDSAPEGEALHREIRAADYRRQFELGADIDTNRIAARLADGVLQLTLPKAPELQPCRIEVAG